MRLTSLMISLLALSLLALGCSAATLSAQDAQVSAVGESAVVNITLDSAPNGISGYFVTVSVTDPAVANLTSVTFPSWAGLHFNAPLPSTECWISAADLNETITPGSTNVPFASFTVKGLQAGSTTITIDILEIDDYYGDPFTPSIQPGTFTVWMNYTINSSAGAGGTISPSGMVSVPSGTDKTFDITPDMGYTIADVQVDSVSQGAVPNYTFTDVQEDHTISASFSAVPVNFTINASAGAGGSIAPSGLVTVLQGTDKTFNVTPNGGYTIADVQVDSVSQGAVPNYTFTNVQANHTISATFSYIPVSYTIDASAGMGGSIAPSGSVSVPEGMNQTFDITPDMGYAIDDVLVDSVSQGAVSDYTFTDVQEDHTISATFFQVTHTLTATAGAGGTISPSGMVIVPEGMNQTFTIAASSGFAIDDVLVDSVSQGAVASYTFTNVTANHTISAEFTLNPANKATLYVASYPTGATIYLDGLNVGKTDQFIYHAPAGVHNLTLAKGGYASKTLMVTIPVEGLKVLEPITLVANGGPTGSGTLYVASYPTNAVILIDGVESGHTNTFVYGVSSGLRNLTLTKDGYQPKTTFVQVPSGDLKVLAPITLSPV
jgi:hypothetical protein